MDTNIVRQPIISIDSGVIGYEIIYDEKAEGFYNQVETQVANTIESFLLSFDGESFVNGQVAYLTFTPNLLLKNIPKMFRSDKLVIQIEDSSIIHPLAQRVIQRCKKQGYRIAIQGFEFAARYFQILDIVDIIKIDFSKHHDKTLENIIVIARSLDKEIIAYHVDTPVAYATAKALGIKQMQGSAVAQALSVHVKKIDHLQSNFLKLVVAITADEPDIDQIGEIISRDVTLTFSLIKLVNSAYFALRNRATSVKQALIILGLGQLKHWVYLLSFKKDEGVMSELIKTSFLRANLCSELSQYVSNCPISKSEAYLLGMFSTLGILLDQPLEKALEQIVISDEIKNALIHEQGRCGLLYRLVLCYENADWAQMSEYAAQLGISNNVIARSYFECVEYVNQIWRDLNEPYQARQNQDDSILSDGSFAMSE